MIKQYLNHICSNLIDYTVLNATIKYGCVWNMLHILILNFNVMTFIECERKTYYTISHDTLKASV